MLSASDEYASDRLRRLREINNFAKALNESDRHGIILPKSEIEQRLKSLVASGQGVFEDAKYNDVARAVITIGEAISVIENTKEISRGRAKPDKILLARSTGILDPIVKSSLDSIEGALNILGIQNELGGI
jgi:hypothetical protein